MVSQRTCILAGALAVFASGTGVVSADMWHGINPGAVYWNGTIALTDAKAAAIAASGCRAIRMNFRLGGYAAWDVNALATYDQIVQNATNNHLVILGLLCNECTPYGQSNWNDDPSGTGMNSYVTTFSTTAYTLIDRYKSQIKRWEIWNEPDVSGATPITDPKTAGGTYILPDVYANLLCETYKQCNYYNGCSLLTANGITLCSGGLGANDNTGSPDNKMAYMQQVYNQTTVWNSFASLVGRRYPWDFFGFHFYINQFGTFSTNNLNNNFLGPVRSTQAAANDTTPLLITEFGWNTTHVSENAQKTNMNNAYNDMQAFSYIVGTYWYQWQDESTTDEWGILRADGTQKPSYNAFVTQNTGAPVVPTGLTATAGDALAVLKWNGGAGATTYNVKRSTTSGSGYVPIATGVAVTTYADVGCMNGATCYYVVSAVNNNTESGNSAQASATPFAGAMNSNLPAGGNLATSMTQAWATDSYNTPGQVGSMAIDGLISFDSKWVSNGNGPPHWLAIDLGKPVTINGYILRNASAEGEPTYLNTKNFSIQSGPSLSGPWTDEVLVDNSGQLGACVRSYYVPKTLQYIRLNITNTGIDNYARIPEFEIWGPIIPTIGLSTNMLSNSCQLGTNASAQSFTIQNTGTGALAYAFNDVPGWLSLAPAAGTSGGEVQLVAATYLTAGLAAGNYSAAMTVTAPGATNSPQTLTINLTVLRPFAQADFDNDGDVDQEDFGHFQACLAGTGIGPGCGNCDFTGNGNVDASDTSLFLNCFSGPNSRTSTNCAN